MQYTHSSDDSRPSVKRIYEIARNKGYVAKNIGLLMFISMLAEKGVFFIHSLSVNGKTYTRYRTTNDYDAIAFVSTLEQNGFFSMSTALEIQSFMKYEKPLVFYSYEQSRKTINDDIVALTQKKIDDAFSKGYRYTKKIADFGDKHVVVLQPKFTNNVEIIFHDNYRVSSVNRALVEMIINIQYFGSLEKILLMFKPLREYIDPQKVYSVLEKMDLIYPYFNSVGFFLEYIGFKKNELELFKKRVSSLNFYFEKGKTTYTYNDYWKVYV